VQFSDALVAAVDDQLTLKDVLASTVPALAENAVTLGSSTHEATGLTH
jgi:hypothetical protein